MAPPHFDLENPVKRFFHEQKSTIFGRLDISRERVTMFLPMFFALLISGIFPSVSQLESIWFEESTVRSIDSVLGPLNFLRLSLVPIYLSHRDLTLSVFTIFLIRRDLRGCLRMGEYMVLGSCVGAAFSIAVSHITHNKWVVWVCIACDPARPHHAQGFFTGFSLLLLLIHSIGQVDFVRLTWPKIALVSAVITILFSTDKLCDVCEFNKRVLRILTLFLVPPVIFHVCNAFFASNGGEWHLPRQFHLFLVR